MSKIYVGALTNKPFAFKNRSWELSNVYSIDILDSLGSNLMLCLYGAEIRRILPLKNDHINEDWISNRSRYFFEGLLKWRLNIPLLKKAKKFIYISWIQSFYYFFLNIWFYSVFFKIKTLGMFLNFILDLDLIITTKLLSNLLGFSIIKNNKIDYINDFYLFFINSFFFDDIQNKTKFLFLGINLRLEAPILNIKLRKNFFKENVLYLNIGALFNDNLNSVSIGLNIKNLINLLKGKLKINISIIKFIKQNLKKNNINNNQNDYLFILGNNIILQKDNINIYNLILQKLNLSFKDKFNNNKYLLLLNNLNLKDKYIKIIKKELKLNLNVIYLNLLYILYEEFLYKNIHDFDNLEELKMFYIINGNLNIKKKENFIVFQGHLLDISILNIDLILPNMTFLEKSSKFLNIEGSLLLANKVLSKPNYSRNDWMILNAFYVYILNNLNKMFYLNNNNNKILNSKRYYIHIFSKKTIYKYIKKYSLIYIYKELTKYSIYNNYILSILQNNKILYIKKIFNKIIYNYYNNIYNIYVIDKYSKTLKLVSHNYSLSMRNYANI